RHADVHARGRALLPLARQKLRQSWADTFARGVLLVPLAKLAPSEELADGDEPMPGVAPSDVVTGPSGTQVLPPTGPTEIAPVPVKEAGPPKISTTLKSLSGEVRAR